MTGGRGGVWGGCPESGTDATRPQAPGLGSGTRLFVRTTNESGQDSAGRSQTEAGAVSRGLGPRGADRTAWIVGPGDQV